MNIRAIAKLAGCSASTVSRVLSGRYGNVRVSEQVRERIRLVCRQHNYEPNIHAARAFATRCGMVAMTLSEDIALEDENLSRFMDGLYHELYQNDYRLLIMRTDRRFSEEKRHLALFRRREVDGLVVWGFSGERHWLDELFQEKCPFVLSPNSAAPYPMVSCAEETGMTAMVNQCLARGARRFVYLDGRPVEVSLRRRAAALAALSGAEVTVLPGGFFTTDGQAAVPEILRLRPEAVVCVNDRTAIGVMLGLKEAGLRIPEDILVTGADNIPLSEHFYPALTTYDQRARDCGEESARLILAQIEAKHSSGGLGCPDSRQLPPELKLRRSA